MRESPFRAMSISIWIWWRHQMETLSSLLVICAGNSPVTGEFRAQRPVTRSFDVFFDLRLNKRLSKQSRSWWFETLSRSLWRHFLPRLLHTFHSWVIILISLLYRSHMFYMYTMGEHLCSIHSPNYCKYCHVTSSNGNIIRATGPLCGEFAGHRWVPLTKASDAELEYFPWSAPKRTVG